MGVDVWMGIKTQITGKEFPERRPVSRRRERLMVLAAVLLILLLTAPISYQRIYGGGWSDFPEHVHYAKLILAGQLADLPSHVPSHPVYHLLLVGLHLLTFRRVGMFALAFLLQVLIQFLSAGIIYAWLGGTDRAGGEWKRFLLVVALLYAAPLMLFAFWDGLFYLGYIGLATYHNPTIHLLRPVALLSFLVSIRIFSHPRNSSRFVAASAGLLILSALVKPNYLLCLLPALVLLAVLRWWKKLPVDWRLLSFGYLVPGVLILLLQYGVTYLYPAGEPGAVLFSPLTAVRTYSGYLPWKFMLSILFPLVVLATNFRRALRYNPLLLAWLGFLASLPQMYLLAETGVRALHGNFLWGAQIMSFILFVASAVFLWREQPQPAPSSGNTRNRIAWLALGLHVIAGAVHYVNQMTAISYY
jgi:hypothetical protein